MPRTQRNVLIILTAVASVWLLLRQLPLWLSLWCAGALISATGAQLLLRKILAKVNKGTGEIMKDRLRM